MSRTDLQTYLHELLMKQDQMSMAASIESRVPFLDDELIDHVARLPSALKVRMWQTKAIFREAVRDIIPRAILARPKMGFPVPVGRWLQGGFWPIVPAVAGTAIGSGCSSIWKSGNASSAKAKTRRL